MNRQGPGSGAVRCSVWSCKQLIASIADSQRTMCCAAWIADPEEAGVFAGARRKAPPDAAARASQFGADRTVRFPRHHHEHRVAARVRVQLALVDQRRQDRRGQTTLLDQVAAYSREMRLARRRQVELGTRTLTRGRPDEFVSGRCAATGRGGGARRRGGVEAWLRISACAGRWGGGDRVAEMTSEPLDGLPRVPTAQVHCQVDRAAAALGGVPVKEFRAGDRKRATRGAHRDLSQRSRTAPQEVKTTSNGISRTRSARRRKSSRVTAHSSRDERCGDGRGSMTRPTICRGGRADCRSPSC